MSQLKWVGFAFVAAFTGLVTLMLVGYTVADPGGWVAVGLIAAGILPVVALSLVAHRWPDAALRVLAVASLAPIGFGLMQLVDYGRWSAWEDSHGPIGLVLVIGIAFPLAVAGLARPAPAGLLMIALCLVPAVLAAIGAGSQWYLPLSIALVSAPVAVSGLLFYLAGRSASTAGVPSGHRFAH